MKNSRVWAALLLSHGLAAGELEPEQIRLPELRIDGVIAQAHTQGCEVLGQDYYVTARRDDVRVRRALLLRCSSPDEGWDYWDITPHEPAPDGSLLDHPGGFQSDGARLWIPVSTSRPEGPTLIRAYSIDQLRPGDAAHADVEIAVEDHIGALAVLPPREEIIGASWDTRDVYVWTTKGKLLRQFPPVLLERLGLGVSRDTNPRSGVAVQDWKWHQDRLLASGLYKRNAGAGPAPRSRLLIMDNMHQSNPSVRTVELPAFPKIELSREGMAVSGRYLYFLPEDLGTENRILRVSVDKIMDG